MQQRRFLDVLILLGYATIASAHSVFVVPQPGGATAQVILSEDLKPSEKVDAGLIGGTKLKLRDAHGREISLTLVKADHAFVTQLPGAGTRLIHGVSDLGWMQQGQEKPYLLLYYPKTIVGDAFDPNAVVGGQTPVEIIAVGKPGALCLRVLARGKPQPNTEVTIILPDGSTKKLTTNQAGLTEVLTQTGRYGAWARYWEPVGGERDGKSYAETRNYATLVFDVSRADLSQPGVDVSKADRPKGSTVTSDSGSTVAAAHLALLPQATSSFGAVVSDGWLYVYGGHVSPTHSYSTESVSGQFARWRLSGGTTWEHLPSGPGLQGMNLAAYKGKIYRIGGMAPRNKPGEPEATYSVADCARFDPGTMQ